MNAVSLLPSHKQFTVGKILCLGQNYADHAKEMGGNAPSSPIIFLKPSTAIIENGAPIVIPKFSDEVHHEVELTVLIGRKGKQIAQSDAYDFVVGYGIGLDMTMRDRQKEARAAGNPWTIAKGFDTSAPLSPFVPKAQVADPHNLNISLKVNGVERQHSNTSNMIFHIDFIIAFLSSIFTLEEGDVIYTGTPEGVGKVSPGDVIEAEIPSVGALRHNVVSSDYRTPAKAH
ncbi:MAG TPA: fumarylacetoacetate hydrolase family protein [Bacteroidota bacterium]|nr:fumarylacetoacetate hydrolase family protein [Bacteroidota bacterium]